MLQQSSHSSADRGLDAYFTPREAVDSLIGIEYGRLPRHLWEPACGNGAIVKVLEQAGYLVKASDITDYGEGYPVADYFKTSISPLIQGIVTNPPFKLALDFAKKGIRECQYVALLLRTNFLESTSRLEFFRIYPPSRVWISSRRLPMMHRNGWTGPEAPSNTCHAWFIWDDSKVTRDERLVRVREITTVNWFDWKDFVKPQVIEKSAVELGL